MVSHAAPSKGPRGGVEALGGHTGSRVLSDGRGAICLGAGGLTRGWLALSNTQLNLRLLGYDIVLAGINVWLVRVVLCYRAHTVLAFLDLWEIHTASIIGYYHCIMYIWPLQNCKIWHLCSGWWSKKKRSKLYYRRKKIHFTKWCLLMTWITTWAPNKLSRVSVFFFTGHIIIVMGSEAAGHPIYKQWA